MKEGLVIEGRWQIHGEGHTPQYGKLICDPLKGLRLETKETKELDWESTMGREASRWSNQSKIIQGWSADNKPIRLYGCVDEGTITKSRIQTHRFYVYRAVTNLSDRSWPELKSRNFQLRFSMLQSWMDRKFSVRDDNSYPADIRIPINSDLTVVLGVIIRSHTSRCRFEVSYDSWLGLEYTDDQSLGRVRHEDTHALALFLTLLVGSPIALDDFKFLEEGAPNIGPTVRGHQILERRGYYAEAEDEKSSWLMRASFPQVKDNLHEMLRRWFELMKNHDMRAVLDLYSAVMFSDLYDTAQFLILAQALEAYHTACGRFVGTAMPKEDFAALQQRAAGALMPEDYAILRERFIFGNSKTYREKLEELVAAAPAQARIVVPDAADFANVVKNLRNAYTHHVGTHSQRTRRQHGSQVPQLAQKARSLLEMLLLFEIGAPDCTFNRIIIENNTSAFVDFRDLGHETQYS